MRRLVRLVQNPPDFLIDLDRRRLGVVLMLRELAAEEDGFFFLAEGGGAEVGHAPLADHASRHVGGAFDVVAGAGR